MSKFLKSLVVGTATGLATAYFLTSEKGKEVSARLEKAMEAYKENPEEYRKMAKEKSQEYGDLAKNTFNDYKNKFESGEIKPEQVFETVKEKTNQFVQKAGKTFNESNSTSDVSEEMTETADVNATEEDIIIDYDEIKPEGNEFDNQVEDDVLKTQTESSEDPFLSNEFKHSESTTYQNPFEN